MAYGEVETDDGVLVLRRIHVVLTLWGVAGDKAEAAQRTHDVFRLKCPIYRSLYRAIDISTELRLEETPPSPAGDAAFAPVTKT